jgi:putative FmdB family regulatory protein
MSPKEVQVPTYQYACTACGHELEAVQSFSDDALTTCPECSGALRKLFGNVGVVFKGSGFYRTDSRKSDAASSASGTSSDSSGTRSDTGKSDTGKSDTGKSSSAKSDTGKSSSAKSDTGKSTSGKAATPSTSS